MSLSFLSIILTGNEKNPIKEIDLAKIEKEHAEAKLARLTTDHESRVIKLEQVIISFIFFFCRKILVKSENEREMNECEMIK